MACTLEKIEHLERRWNERSGYPWKMVSHSRRWLKSQMNRFIRRQGKKITEDDRGYKQGRKMYKGWEY